MTTNNRRKISSVSDFTDEMPSLASSGDLRRPLNGTLIGHERLARLTEALDAFNITRSATQRDVHRNTTRAVIREIFENDYDEPRPRRHSL
jgi:hypothetical protein